MALYLEHFNRGETLEERRTIESARERELYFAARNRALERLTDQNSLIHDSQEGFEAGIAAACGSISSEELLELVKRNVAAESTWSFSFICGFLVRMEAIKGRQYLASWMKKGEKHGALVNVQRKMDRLDAAILLGDNSVQETITETLGDQAVYDIKWLALRAEIDFEQFINWLEEIRKL